MSARLASWSRVTAAAMSAAAISIRANGATTAAAPTTRKFSTLKQINKIERREARVGLDLPLRRDDVSIPSSRTASIYGKGRNSSLVALDAATGKEIWIHEGLQGMTRARHELLGEQGRQGSAPDLQHQRLPAGDRRDDRQVDHRRSATTASSICAKDSAAIRRRSAAIQSGTPGKVFENLIILGSAPGEAYLSPPGDLRAYDVVTGKLAWQFHTVPHPGEFGYDTWPKDAWKYIGGTNTWGEITVDAERGIAYFPTGSPTYDYYGADRIGANLFANCLLALDARTGKRLWHFQNVHHDLWDYDNTAAPQLTTIRHNGKNDRRRRAGGQDRIPLRLQSRDRRADLADRGAAGPDERRARRAGLADAAVSDQPAAVRAAEVHGRRHQPVHAHRRPSANSSSSASPRRGTRGCSRRSGSAKRSTCRATTAARTSAARRRIRPTARVYVISYDIPAIMRLLTPEEAAARGDAAAPAARRGRAGPWRVSARTAGVPRCRSQPARRTARRWLASRRGSRPKRCDRR